MGVLQSWSNFLQGTLEPTRREEREDDVGLLDEQKQRNWASTGTGILNNRSRRSYLVIAIVGLALVFIALVLPSGKVTSAFSRPIPALQQEDYYLDLVLQTNLGSLDLCKTLLSGSALDYPTPWLIESRDANGNADDLARMLSIKEWISNMPENHNRDLVMIMGSLPWFQVKPEVVLKRYFGIRERGDRSLHKSFTSNTIEKHSMQTQIVFATEKRCLSEDQDCPPFLAGDKSTHYLSSDLLIGPLAEVRALWEHATAKAIVLSGSGETVDQNHIFAQILLEQELHRESLAKLAGVRNSLDITEGGRKDFGIFLDFSRELSYAADDKLEGVDWVKHPLSNDSKLSLPEDIGNCTKPFRTLSASAEVPINDSWSDVPFLTGLGGNIIPALLSRGRGSDEDLSSSWWEKLWFQPYSRQLLDNYSQMPLLPATIINEEGKELRFWGAHRDSNGVMGADLVFHPWEEICGSEEDADALFLDGKGSWQNPVP